MKIPKPHQVEAAKFIAERGRCALWLPPRGGKSLSTVLGLELLKTKNVLIICPVTVMPVWKAEFEERNWPGVRVAQGTPSAKRFAAKYTEGPVVCSFDSAWRLPEIFARPWDAIVFDESVRLANWTAKSVQCWAKNSFLTKNVILLSGAPCPEGPLQLAMQMIICRGSWFNHSDIYGYLQEFWHYDAIRYKWLCDSHGHLAEIKRRMNIVGLSKSAKEIGLANEKLLRTISVAMPEDIKTKCVNIENDATILPMVRASKIQALSNGLAGEDGLDLISEFKADAIVRYIQERRQEEPAYSAVIMCKFVVQAEDLAYRLQAACITGAITGEARDTEIKKFQKGLVKDIVCQEKVAKMGIDLSRGSEIHYASNTWSGDDRIQSQERCSNLTRTSPVGIIDWCSSSVEHAIANAVRDKKDFQVRMLDNHQ